MKSVLAIIADGTEYDVSTGDVCYWAGFSGFGAAPVKRLSDQGPEQHGVSDIGFRLEPRALTSVFVLAGRDEAAIDAQRDRLYDILRPRADALSLRLYRADGSVRQIDVHVAGQPVEHASDGIGWNDCSFTQRTAVGFYAPDPAWYDPTVQSVTYGVGASSGAWTIPWAIPWGIGSATIDQTRSVTYAGNWQEYPRIRIVGPITSPVIINETTGEVLDFTGTTINAGDHFDIDLRYGRKSVVDSAGANQIAALSDDSDLATWHLEPASLAVPDGVNSIRVTGSAGTTATEIYLTFYHRYTGA